MRSLLPPSVSSATARLSGYGLEEVKGEELTKAKETNVINSLSGKVAGLVVQNTAGGASGSTRVLLRGNTEMAGNNQPLYVVDGVPLDNTNFGSAGEAGGYDLGDGISAINPDDIETMTVLKVLLPLPSMVAVLPMVLS